MAGGARSSRKGTVWERQVVALLESWGFAADRVPAMLESRGGPTGVDVRAVRSTGQRLAVQCKVGARPDVWQAVTECDTAAHAREVPVAIVRRNHGKRDGHPRRSWLCRRIAFRRLVDGARPYPK